METGAIVFQHTKIAPSQNTTIVVIGRGPSTSFLHWKEIAYAPKLGLQAHLRFLFVSIRVTRGQKSENFFGLLRLEVSIVVVRSSCVFATAVRSSADYRFVRRTRGSYRRIVRPSRDFLQRRSFRSYG